jgi:hypothetical protein
MGAGSMELTASASEIASIAELIGDRVLVLHGPDDEGTGLSGRDIDCLVDGIDHAWPLRLPATWRLCQHLRYEPRGWYWVIEGDGRFVAFDTTDDPLGLGRDAIRTSPLVSRSVDRDRSSFRAAYVTVKRVRKGETGPGEWARIGEVARESPPAFTSALEAVGGRSLARILAPWALAGHPPPPHVVRRVGQLRWLRRFGSPVRIIKALSYSGQRYAERVGRPAGFQVLVVGPDGAGKSTVASRIPELVAPAFKRVTRSHWRPGILPRPGAFLGRAAADHTRPHARRAVGPGPSFVLLAYYWLDFLLGAALRDQPSKIRAGLIVRERGWWDLGVDAHRYRLRVSPRLVRALGALLPKPDLVVVLEADPDVLRSRKDELAVEEMARQLVAWRWILPVKVKRMHADVSRSLDEVLTEIRGAILEQLESRAVSRLPGGWIVLPPGRARWWIPRAPSEAARAGLSVYQPVTRRGQAGWNAARLGASIGGFRLLPRGEAPPATVRHRIAPLVPFRGSYAIGRANHPGRYIALILGRGGRRLGVAKVATDDAGSEALERERIAIEKLGPLLPPPLSAPKVLECGEGVLMLAAVPWVPRKHPWWLDEEVARALGTFFREGADGAGLGPVHGDFAPWNVLKTESGWAVVDWENAAEEGVQFHDLSHYLVQAHALLGRPSEEALLEGFRRRTGSVGRAVVAYTEGAGIPADGAADALRTYLRASEASLHPRTAGERRGVQRRRRLLTALET